MNRPPRVLAIDLSTAATGLAAWDEHNPACVETVDPGRAIGYPRTRATMRAITAAYVEVAPDVVVMEDLPPSAGKMGNSLVPLAMLHGVVRYYLAPRVPVAFVHVSHVKMYATGSGSGKGSDKTAVSLAVERRYGRLIAVADDNQADAFVMLAMTLHHYGHPLASVPQTHAQALTRVTWPDLPHLDCPPSAVTPGIPPTDFDAGRAPTGGTR